MELAMLILGCGVLVSLTSATYYYPRSYPISRSQTPVERKLVDSPKKSDSERASSLNQYASGISKVSSEKNNVGHNFVNAHVNSKGSESYFSNNQLHSAPIRHAGEGERVEGSLGAYGSLVVPGYYIGLGSGHGGHEESFAASGGFVGGLGSGAAGSFVGGYGPLGSYSGSNHHVGEGHGGPIGASAALSGSVLLPPGFVASLFHHEGHRGSVAGSISHGGIEYQEKRKQIPNELVGVMSYPYLKEYGYSQPFHPIVYLRQGYPGKTGAYPVYPVYGPTRQIEQHQVVISGIPNIHASGSFGVHEGSTTGQGAFITTQGNPWVISFPVAVTDGEGQMTGQSPFIQFIQRPFQFIGSFFQPQTQTGTRQPTSEQLVADPNLGSPAASGDKNVEAPQSVKTPEVSEGPAKSTINNVVNPSVPSSEGAERLELVATE